MGVSEHVQGVQPEQVLLHHQGLGGQRRHLDRGHPGRLLLLSPEQVVNSEGLLLCLSLLCADWRGDG